MSTAPCMKLIWHDLSRLDFERAEYQAIFELVEESLAQDQSEPMHYVLNGLSLPLMEIVDKLVGAYRKTRSQRRPGARRRDAGFVGNPPASGD